MSIEFNVWMNGELVGVWFRTRTGGHRLTYEETWLQSPRRRSLSLLLPIGPSRETTGTPVSSYFENLLPDNDNIRRRLSTLFRTRGTEAFELLTAIGRDRVGAAELLPPETAPEGFDRIDSVPVCRSTMPKSSEFFATSPPNHCPARTKTPMSFAFR